VLCVPSTRVTFSVAAPTWIYTLSLHDALPICIEAITSTNLDIRPMMARIRQLQQETQNRLVETERVIDIRAAALREQVDRQLASHQKRLKAYLAQSHLAVARLYDKALRKQAP